jgi:hypothetical protein
MIGIDVPSIVAMVGGGSASLPITINDRPATLILFAGENDETLAASVRQMARNLDRPVVDIDAPPSAAIN